MTSPDPRATSPNGAGPPQVAAPGRVAVDQWFDADGLYTLRAEVAAHASDLGATAPQTEKLVIVAGELATNAIRHGGGRGRLRLWRDGNLIICQVSDNGPGISDPGVGTTPPDQTAMSGRGLWVCRQLCESFLIEVTPTGTTVTGSMRLHHDDMRHGGQDTG